MTRDDAIRLLTAGSAHERLKAARYLARSAQKHDFLTLRAARQTETVSYVKASLDVALARLSHAAPAVAPDPADEFDVPPELRRQIYSQAVKWVTGLLLHEVSSRIGLVSRAASREIHDYENSRTKRYIEGVEDIFVAIEQFKGVTAVPIPQPFDLAEMVQEALSDAITDTNATEVSLHGPKPMMIISDPTLVRLVIDNGLRNALEAVSTSESREAHPIVITWGHTDIDYWLAILDRGVGIIGPTDAAFEIGKSTKKGHSGFGLAIARQAIETLGGTIMLTPVSQGGTKYEARWER